MATPTDQLIIENLQTRLEAIKTPTYRTDVDKVEQEIRGPDEVVKPWIGIAVLEDDESETQPFDVAVHRMKFMLLAYVEGRTPKERRENLAAIRDDIKVAIYGDVTRGGNARDTRPLRGEMNVGEADEDFGVFAHEFEVIYAIRLTTAE